MYRSVCILNSCLITTHQDVWQLVRVIPTDIITMKYKSLCESSFNEEHFSFP